MFILQFEKSYCQVKKSLNTSCNTLGNHREHILQVTAQLLQHLLRKLFPTPSFRPEHTTASPAPSYIAVQRHRHDMRRCNQGVYSILRNTNSFFKEPTSHRIIVDLPRPRVTMGWRCSINGTCPRLQSKWCLTTSSFGRRALYVCEVCVQHPPHDPQEICKIHPTDGIEVIDFLFQHTTLLRV